MILHLKKIARITTLILLLFITVPAEAQAPTPGCFFGDFESGIISGCIDNFISSDASSSLVSFMQRIVNLVTAIIVSVGLISIVIGGYFYITAGGSSDRVGTAKTWIVSALAGIILALMSWVILNTISSQFVNPEIRLPRVSPAATAP